MSSPHQTLNVPGWPEPRGYSDAMLAAPGRLLVLGGHVAFDAERRITHPNELVPQMRRVLENLRATLAAAGGGPEHLVKLTIHTTDVPAYRAQLRDLGAIWIDVLGRTFPAMTLLGVASLFDEGAVLEIDGLAVIP